MTIAEIDELFRVDEKGIFINLIIPEDEFGPKVDFRGRKQLEMSIDEIIRVKKYASKLYGEAIKSQ